MNQKPGVLNSGLHVRRSDFALEPGRVRNYSLPLMEKPMTKSEISASLAQTTGLTKEQVSQTLDALTELAYKNAKNSFTIPGLGKLVLVDRQARVGRNPATGEQINIPAKRVVKFRIAKAAKDAILGQHNSEAPLSE